jgi:hypothetical protein
MYVTRAWSLIRNEKKPIVLFERHCHATEKSEAIAHCMCMMHMMHMMPVIPVNKVVDRKE